MTAAAHRRGRRGHVERHRTARVGWLRARHVPVAGTGHYVHLEDPDATMAAIAPFVAEVDG